MKKILIYVGVNKGYGLYTLLTKNKYDLVYGFEPDPELYKDITKLFSPYSFIKLINSACSASTGTSKLYITKNRCSTSLAEPNKEAFDPRCGDGIDVIDSIEVNTINLFDFICQNNIQEIEYLVLDTQGNDLNILKTLTPLINKRKIKTIFTETHKNGHFFYSGMDNQYDKFKELLDKNYEVSYFSADDTIISKEKDPNELVQANEWDTCWILKENI